MLVGEWMTGHLYEDISCMEHVDVRMDATISALRVLTHARWAKSDVDQHTKEWVSTGAKGTGERLAEGLHRDMERMWRGGLRMVIRLQQ